MGFAKVVVMMAVIRQQMVLFICANVKCLFANYSFFKTDKLLLFTNPYLS